MMFLVGYKNGRPLLVVPAGGDGFTTPYHPAYPLNTCDEVRLVATEDEETP